MTNLRRSNLRQPNKSIALASDWGVYYYKAFLLAGLALAACAAIAVFSWDIGGQLGAGSY